MGRLLRDGVALAYQEAGSGAPPLMLVHDLGADHSCFASQLAFFSRAHRVVAVDLRGHGQSGGKREGCTIEVLADDLAWLGYELGLYRPVLVGWGLGGAVALDLAARYPDLPAAVVVVGPAETSAATPDSAMPLPFPQGVPPPVLEDVTLWDRANLAWSHVPVIRVCFHTRESALTDRFNPLLQQFLSQLAGRAPH